MSNAFSYVSGLEVITSGSFVLNQDDFVEFFPFNNDPQFKVQVRLDMQSGINAAEIDYDYVGDKTVVFTISKKFNNNTTISTSQPIEFAEEDDQLSDYFASIALTTFGTEDRHTAILNYTILRKYRAQEGR